MADGDKVLLRVPCIIYARIVGYMTPIGSWNVGKKQEFKDRKTFERSVEKWQSVETT